MAEDRHGLEPDAEATDAGPEDAMPGTSDFISDLAEQLGLGNLFGPEASQDFARKQLDEHRQEMKREADIFRETFSTPTGRKCLDILVSRTLLRRTFGFELEAKRLQDLTVAAIVRETENNFVAAILEAIAFANNKDIQIRQEA